jgi:hypothetical protein
MDTWTHKTRPSSYFRVQLAISPQNSGHLPIIHSAVINTHNCCRSCKLGTLRPPWQMEATTAIRTSPEDPSRRYHGGCHPRLEPDSNTLLVHQDIRAGGGSEEPASTKGEGVRGRAYSLGLFVCLFGWLFGYARNQGPLSFTRYAQDPSIEYAPPGRARYHRLKVQN